MTAKYENGTVEMSVDNSPISSNEEYRFESGIDVMTLLNKSMKMALDEQNPNHSIQMLLEFWGKELNSDRTYIFEILDDDLYYNTFEWCREGINPEIDGLQGIPKEVGTVWIQELQKSGYALVKNVEDIKDSNPLLYDV